MTRREQALLFGVGVAVLLGAAALVYDASRRDRAVAPAVQMPQKASGPKSSSRAHPKPPLAEPPKKPAAPPVALPAIPASTPAAQSTPPEPSPIAVGVTGAVLRPGLYHLEAGARMDDLLKAAGGATPGADLEALDRAAPVADGATVAVPYSRKARKTRTDSSE
jgi:competence protein ComEA